MQRRCASVALLGVAALALAGLRRERQHRGGPAAPGSAAPAARRRGYAGPVGAGRGQLSVLAWPGYAEDGSTDPTVDWVTPFEQATGCQVTVKTFATSAEAVQLFSTGEYDVVSASGDASLRLVYGDRVQPVNTGLVPNYADVFPDLKDKPWNTVAGAELRHPARPRRQPAALQPARYPTPPTSWRDMWDATRRPRARSARTTTRSTSPTPPST